MNLVALRRAACEHRDVLNTFRFSFAILLRMGRI